MRVVLVAGDYTTAGSVASKLATVRGRARARRGRMPETIEDRQVQQMPFSWRYETGDGSVVTAEGLPRERFPTQADAESWIGESWRELLDGGVDQVSLLEGERVVYGPMSLHPAE